MNAPTPTTEPVWPLWQRILFRFFFIYLVLEAAPLAWWDRIPGLKKIGDWYGDAIDWLVHLSNRWIFHVRPVLVPTAGSGDTSAGWAEQWLYVLLGVVGCLVWSLAQPRKKNYTNLNYWLCLMVRYFLILVSFGYGFAKIFLDQMSFPTMSQLATPLGDFLPMRLSWLFIGYSSTYEIFSGVMEVLVGILLLFRRTATMGTLLALAVFSNVMMMNLSYDIPVKIFSTNIVIFCLYLLANDFRRIYCFFVLNTPAAVCSRYEFSYRKKWMRITRVALKAVFVVVIILWPLVGYFPGASGKAPIAALPIKPGFYEVVSFRVNNDSAASAINPLRWRDVIFESYAEAGSVNTPDTSFRQRYRRGYFRYKADTVKHTIDFKKSPSDSAVYPGVFMTARYQLIDSNTVALHSKLRNDSIYALLRRVPRHFQLAERQFHWLSEYNR